MGLQPWCKSIRRHFSSFPSSCYEALPSFSTSFKSLFSAKEHNLICGVAITRCDLETKARCHELVDQGLNDRGFDERGHGSEIQVAAKRYFMDLVQEDLENNEDAFFNESFDSAEGFTLGFVADYDACLRAHR